MTERAKRGTNRVASVWPGVAVTALLVAAALPMARGRAPASIAPAPDALYYGTCTDVLEQESDQSDTTAIAVNGGITQPIASQGNVAGVTLDLTSGYVTQGWSVYNLVAWDPGALAPDYTTDPLRMGYYSVSGGTWTGPYLIVVPPVILRQVPALAEPPRHTVAFDLRLGGSSPNMPSMTFGPNGDGSIPVGFTYTSQAGPRTPLPGAQGVFGHTICGGDADLQRLSVLQSVVTASAQIDSTAFDVVQRFRVPQQCQVRWIEVASGSTARRTGAYAGTMGIVDAANDLGTPPTNAELAAPLVNATFVPPIQPTWTSHYDFDHIVTLQPNHDYWLWLSLQHTMGAYTRQATGGEGTAYTSTIGELYARTDSSLAFAQVSGQALDFKLIGIPMGTVGVAPTPRAGSAFALRARPNPAHGAVTIAWSGARGAVRFEVLDARGRRVASGEGTASASGEWRWTAAPTAATPLPAGVYFVRARDAAGNTASERVVLAR